MNSKGPSQPVVQVRKHQSSSLRYGLVALLALVGLGYYFDYITSFPTSLRKHPKTIEERALHILKNNPLIDGHNDLAITIRLFENNHLYTPSFHEAFENGTFHGHVDLPRMKAGHYAGAFWSAFWLCPSDPLDFSDSAYYPIVQATLSQLDLYHRLAHLYPTVFTPTPSAAAAELAFAQGRTISPYIIEGLHQIGNSVATLRSYYRLGVRYATLTHNCHNRYADAATLAFANGTYARARPYWGGISLAGRQVIREMNLMGMIVDLAHVSPDTMRDILAGTHNPAPRRANDLPVHGTPAVSDDAWSGIGSLAPPIVSHSSAYGVCPHPRNVPDDVLELIKSRNSVVMVNFNPDFVSCVETEDESNGLPTFDPAHNDLAQVVKHITYIGEKIGYAHVGIGSDFDGIESTPRGLEDVSKLPKLVEALLRAGVADAQVAGVVGGNVLRVWHEVDRVAARLREEQAVPLEMEDDEKSLLGNVELGFETAEEDRD